MKQGANGRAAWAGRTGPGIVVVPLVLLGPYACGGPAQDTRDTAAPVNSTAPPEARPRGALYVVSGAALLDSATPADTLAVIAGEAEDDRIGRWLVDLGDLDGDGLPELAVNVGPAEVAVLWGSTLVDCGVGCALRIDPEGVLGDLEAADVDGDGLSDLLVGVEGHDDWDGVLIFRGADLPGAEDQGRTDAFTAVEQEAAWWGVDGALGDTDGDGMPDLAITSQLRGDSDDPVSPRVDIWDGALLSGGGRFTTADGSARLEGEPDLEVHRTTFVGDVDADGLEDLWTGTTLLSGADLRGTISTGNASARLTDAILNPRVHPLPDLAGDGRPGVAMGLSWIGFAEVGLWRGAQLEGDLSIADAWQASDAEPLGPLHQVASLPDLDGGGLPEVALVGAGVRVFRGEAIAAGSFDLAQPAGSFDRDGEFEMGSVVVVWSDLDLDGVSDMVVGDAGAL